MDQDSFDVVRPGGIAAERIACEQHPTGPQRDRRTAQRGYGILITAQPAKPPLNAHSSSRLLREEDPQRLQSKAVLFPSHVFEADAGRSATRQPTAG
jgi:hypothetical protein